MYGTRQTENGYPYALYAIDCTTYEVQCSAHDVNPLPHGITAAELVAALLPQTVVHTVLTNPKQGPQVIVLHHTSMLSTSKIN